MPILATLIARLPSPPSHSEARGAGAVGSSTWVRGTSPGGVTVWPRMLYALVQPVRRRPSALWSLSPMTAPPLVADSKEVEQVARPRCSVAECGTVSGSYVARDGFVVTL